MTHKIIPSLLDSEKNFHFAQAYSSIRKRSPKILKNKPVLAKEREARLI